MGLIDGIRGQLKSVIVWNDIDSDDLFYLWSDNGDEIKNASTLIVGPGQGCIFVHKGNIRAIITEEGSTNLKTGNIPFWTSVSRVMQFFQSEHKVGIFFFKTSKILDQKWGTSSPIKYTDPKYSFPVGLKAYGNYSFRITDPKIFFVNVVASAPRYSIEQLREILTGRLKQPLSDYLAEASFSYAEIDARREEAATVMKKKLSPGFETLGISLTDFRIEGTSFDDDTLRRINRIADVTADVHAAEVAGLDYSELQQIEAMRDAAKNEGGGAGMGMGLGAGMSFGNMMAQSMQSPPDNTTGNTDISKRLAQLKKLADEGLITAAEYTAKKQEILKNL